MVSFNPIFVCPTASGCGYQGSEGEEIYLEDANDPERGEFVFLCPKCGQVMIAFEVKIGPGNLESKGVYAARNFKTGEVVVPYHLTTLTEEEFQALPKNEQEFTHVHQNVIHLYGAPERYVNHSDTPNTVQDFKRWSDVASRDIAKGEMITTDATKDDSV